MGGLLVIFVIGIVVIAIICGINSESPKDKAEREARKAVEIDILHKFNAHCNKCDYRKKIRRGEGSFMMCGMERHEPPPHNVCYWYEGGLDQYSCPKCSGDVAYFKRETMSILTPFKCLTCGQANGWPE